MEWTCTHLRYLLAIYTLSQKAPNVGAAAVARALGVSCPSVTRMLGILTQRGLLERERYGKTDRGGTLSGGLPPGGGAAGPCRGRSAYSASHTTDGKHSCPSAAVRSSVRSRRTGFRSRSYSRLVTVRVSRTLPSSRRSSCRSS